MMRTPLFAIELRSMPFDRYEDNMGFIHATGREIIFSDGSSSYEYEDDPYDDIKTRYSEDEYYHSEDEDDDEDEDGEDEYWD